MDQLDHAVRLQNGVMASLTSLIGYRRGAVPFGQSYKLVKSQESVLEVSVIPETC